MKLDKISLAVVAALTLSSSVHATLINDKITLKGNMVVKYNKLPPIANNFLEAFSEGEFYGRLRLNSFKWDWQNLPPNITSKMDNKAMGIGGSFIYKTAPLHGISATAGLYTSQNPSAWRMNTNRVNTLKSGKDTFSRYDTSATGKYGMSVLAQAYLQYDLGKTSFVAGRQLFETVFTKSNDTKMVPNAFDGITATISDIPKTKIQLAYLAKQKLRDHTTSHDVIAYRKDNPDTDKRENWSENDDSAVNRNLTVARIGDDNELIIGTITNKSIKNLKVNLSYAMVPKVLSNLAVEVHYAIPIASDWSIVPGVRYMQQFDDLNADYNVANLVTKHDGYKESAKQSLDTNLLAARLDIKNKAFLARFGYSKIADEADFVTPWRGFPTGGFTRAMAQYNWNANTKTYMARAGYDFGKAKILDGFSIMGRYAIQDTDDKKAGVAGDCNVIHIDARQNITKNLELKVRFGFVDYADDIVDINGNTKADLSYNEYRVELNYFF
ncbi:MAG: OprD family outer membrane porin [Campylobacterota bacterium]|nr:OprD family outer membrane porin [Campylobacterota bacterium]